MVEVSGVIPTYNEKENLRELCERVFASCEGIELEVVVVDDNSPDGTGELAEELSKTFNVSVVHRTGKSGLSSAVLDGFKKAEGHVLGVMDADLSHPPEVVPKLLEKIDDGCDVVFASRHIPGGGFSNWPFQRKIISKVASLLARPLTKSTDPMSGFFMLRRKVIDGVLLNPVGFKIGLEILVKGHYKQYGEVTYVFRDRASGESKLDARQYIDYLRHLLRLYAFKLKLV